MSHFSEVQVHVVKVNLWHAVSANRITGPKFLRCGACLRSKANYFQHLCKCGE